MPTTVEIKGVLDEKLEILIASGLYASKSEAIRDGLRKLLEQQDFLSIAINLYKNKNISTGRAAEIANLTINDFIKECQKRRVPVKVGIETVDELDKELTLLR